MNTRRMIKYLAVGNALLLCLTIAMVFIDPYELLFRSQSQVDSEDKWKPFDIPKRRPYIEYGRKIAGRRLFEAGMQIEEAVVKRSIIDDYEFLGSSRSPRGPRGFLRNTIDGQTRTIAAGDALGDYVVEAITNEGVVLKQGDKAVMLRR